MATYNVYMNQGITMRDLAANKLSTGFGDIGEMLYSCSAVILFNTGTRAAGLFHFPSGDIYTDGTSRNNIAAMFKAVQPNEAYIAYGTQEPTDGVKLDPKPRVTPSDMYEGELRAYILASLPVACRLRRMNAPQGIALISQNGGVAAIETEHSGSADFDDYISLRKFGAGKYNVGKANEYHLYGKAA